MIPTIVIILLVVSTLVVIGLLFWYFLAKPKDVGFPQNLSVQQNATNKQWYLVWQPPTFTGNNPNATITYDAIVAIAGSVLQNPTGLTGTQLLLDPQPENGTVLEVAVKANSTGTAGTISSGWVFKNLTITGPPNLLSFDWTTVSPNDGLVQVHGSTDIVPSSNIQLQVINPVLSFPQQSHANVNGTCTVSRTSQFDCTFQWTDKYVPPAGSMLQVDLTLQDQYGSNPISKQQTVSLYPPSFPTGVSSLFQ